MIMNFIILLMILILLKCWFHEYDVDFDRYDDFDIEFDIEFRLFKV